MGACVPENESVQRGRAGSPVLPHFLSFAFPGNLVKDIGLSGLVQNCCGIPREHVPGSSYN